MTPSSLRRLFVSDVVAAVAEGAARPALRTAEDLRRALLGAERIAYSTGRAVRRCWLSSIVGS